MPCSSTARVTCWTVGGDIKSECGNGVKELTCLWGFWKNFVIMDCFGANTFFLSNKCLKILTQEANIMQPEITLRSVSPFCADEASLSRWNEGHLDARILGSVFSPAATDDILWCATPASRQDFSSLSRLWGPYTEEKRTVERLPELPHAAFSKRKPYLFRGLSLCNYEQRGPFLFFDLKKM